MNIIVNARWRSCDSSSALRFSGSLVNERTTKMKETRINTLHWYDAKSALPYNDPSSKLIAFKNEDEDRLQWMEAYFNGTDWIKNVRVTNQGILLDMEIVVPDVRYWSDMPAVDFTNKNTK